MGTCLADPCFCLLQYLFKDCCGRQAGTPEEMKLTIGEVNHYLNQLAGDEGNESKVNVLTQLLQVTTPNQMKWIIQILLRDLKVQSQKQRLWALVSIGILHSLSSLECSPLLCMCRHTLEAISHLRLSLMPGLLSFRTTSSQDSPALGGV